MNKTEGAPIRAFLNISDTAFSESPTYGENIEAADVWKKDALLIEAMARTNDVFPQPYSIISANERKNSAYVNLTLYTCISMVGSTWRPID